MEKKETVNGAETEIDERPHYFSSRPQMNGRSKEFVPYIIVVNDFENDFTGSNDFESYITHFELLSQLQKWQRKETVNGADKEIDERSHYFSSRPQLNGSSKEFVLFNFSNCAHWFCSSLQFAVCALVQDHK